MRRLGDLVALKELEIYCMPIMRMRGRRHLLLITEVGFETFVRGPENGKPRSCAELFDAVRPYGLDIALDLECLQRSLLRLDKLAPGQFLCVNVLPQTLYDSRAKTMLLKALQETPRRELILDIDIRGVASFSETFKYPSWLVDRGVGWALEHITLDSEIQSMLAVGSRPRYFKLAPEVCINFDSLNTTDVNHWLQGLAAHAQANHCEIIATGIDGNGDELLKLFRDHQVQLAEGFRFGTPVPVIGPTARRRAFEARFSVPARS